MSGLYPKLCYPFLKGNRAVSCENRICDYKDGSRGTDIDRSKHK